jgi:hypothetical protein
MELMRVEIIVPSMILVEPRSISIITSSDEDETIICSYKLLNISRQCHVRKIDYLHLQIV